MTHQYFTGDSAVSRLAETLESLHAHRVFLVSGQHSYAACGARDVLEPVFERLQCEVVRFSGYSANPKQEEADEGTQKLSDSGADVIIAVGGGSALDTGKLIRHQYNQETGRRVPLCAFPTTAGTGAEATRFAVVYREGRKHSVEAEDILPDYAFVHSPFTHSNSAYQTACSGFDALAQAIEAYWNINANAESDSFAEQAVMLIKDALLETVRQPDADLRRRMAEGAYLAGRAINITRTTAPHAFSYAFTSQCGYPHGHAVAITFPWVAQLNTEGFGNLSADCDRQVYARKMQRLHQLLGIPENGMLEWAEKYTAAIGLTFNGTKDADLKEILMSVNAQRLKNNPVVISRTDIEALYHYLTKHNS